MRVSFRIPEQRAAGGTCEKTSKRSAGGFHLHKATLHGSKRSLVSFAAALVRARSNLRCSISSRHRWLGADVVVQRCTAGPRRSSGSESPARCPPPRELHPRHLIRRWRRKDEKQTLIRGPGGRAGRRCCERGQGGGERGEGCACTSRPEPGAWMRGKGKNSGHVPKGCPALGGQSVERGGDSQRAGDGGSEVPGQQWGRGRVAQDSSRAASISGGGICS